MRLSMRLQGSSAAISVRSEIDRPLRRTGNVCAGQRRSPLENAQVTVSAVEYWSLVMPARMRKARCTERTDVALKAGDARIAGLPRVSLETRRSAHVRTVDEGQLAWSESLAAQTCEVEGHCRVRFASTRPTHRREAEQ